MTYDFAMATDGKTGFNAPQWAVEDSINYWLSQGKFTSGELLQLDFNPNNQ